MNSEIEFDNLRAEQQFILAKNYSFGNGVPKNDELAVLLYHRAAEQGHAEAQSILGGRYAEGRGVLRDDGAAASWFRKAAEQGYAPAQECLGIMYATGQGVPKNYETAIRPPNKGCEVLIFLGVMCALGQNMQQGSSDGVEEYGSGMRQVLHGDLSL